MGAAQLTPSDIRGIIPPLVSPFGPDERLDLEAFRREIRYMTGLGVEMFAVGGSTGDGDVLEPEEIGALCEAAVAEGDAPIIAGVITTSTRDAIRRAEIARDAGARALMATPPIYHPASAATLVSYYDEIWKAVGLPIVVYNILTHAPVAPDVIDRLADLPGVIAIKESAGGSLATLDELLRRVTDRIAVVWALDSYMFEGFALGARSSISAINTILPRESMEMLAAVERGDLAAALDLHVRLRPVVRVTDVEMDWSSRTKCAINLLGRSVGVARRPYVPVSAADQNKLRAALAGVGALVGADS